MFLPVAEGSRRAAWTPDVQGRFLDALAESGVVRTAAAATGMTVAAAFALRRAVGAESFAAAWEAAIADNRARLVDDVYDRALNGWTEAVATPADEKTPALKHKYSERMALALIKHDFSADRLAERQSAFAPPPGIVDKAAVANLARDLRRIWLTGELGEWLDRLEYQEDDDDMIDAPAACQPSSTRAAPAGTVIVARVDTCPPRVPT